MNRRCLAAAAAFLLLTGAAGVRASDAAAVEVFRSGEDGYHTYRIPAVVRTTNGDLLAFAEGRKHSLGDSGDIDLVLKRSVDCGRTWGPIQRVADYGEGVIGNPAPVVDRDSGDVVLLAVMQDPGVHEGDIRAGRKGSRTPCVLRSTDHGGTWTEPRPIGDTADREDWRWYATGPCHAIQLRHGEHAGRLVVPANHSVAGGGGNQWLGAHALISDDAGRTWRIGAVDESHYGDNTLNPNENAVVELPDGRLRFSCRDQHGTSEATRAVAYSSDGGASFDQPFTPEQGLDGPACQGALLGVESPGKGFVVLFSGPGDPTRRHTLQIRYSVGGDGPWQKGPVLYDGPAAYSDLVALDDNRVGVLFEADGYRAIRFMTVDVASIVE